MVPACLACSQPKFAYKYSSMGIPVGFPWACPQRAQVVLSKVDNSSTERWGIRMVKFGSGTRRNHRPICVGVSCLGIGLQKPCSHLRADRRWGGSADPSPVAQAEGSKFEARPVVSLLAGVKTQHFAYTWQPQIDWFPSCFLLEPSTRLWINKCQTIFYCLSFLGGWVSSIRAFSIGGRTVSSNRASLVAKYLRGRLCNHH